MKVLFIHQNFPGQFKSLAPALADAGHTVLATTNKKPLGTVWNGVKLVPYQINRTNSPNLHPWLVDLESKVIRAEACFTTAEKLKQQGFYPDVIVAHYGWGESLFLRDVWPDSKIGIYCEFFYHPKGYDVGFDPEFPPAQKSDFCRVRLKNVAGLLSFQTADAGISPTYWQASTFPDPFKSKITVVHDGIDTEAIAPDPRVNVTLGSNLRLSKKDEIVTFVARDLEPYRGYHIFMRALPDILQKRPLARILIIGADGVSYGAEPTNGKSWRDIFAAEVRSRIQDSDWSRVHFLGLIPYAQFISILQLSSVHVYLTYPFVLSWSLLEAMSVGCAIVASDTPPVHEVIKHDKTGRLIKFFDAQSLAEEICLLLNDPGQREQLGRNARTFARQAYDLNSVCLPKQIAWVESLFAD